MQVEELYDLTMWIRSEIAEMEIVQKYQQLHAILQVNTQPGQKKRPFEEERDRLISSLRDVPLLELSVGQIEVLGAIGIGANVGPEGAETVEGTLFKNALDIASAEQRIQQCISEISGGVRWAEQTQNALSKIVHTEEVRHAQDRVLLRVHFTNEAHLSNLTEFKEWGKTWWEIGRGIAMAHGEAPENISVVGAGKGSIVISLLSAYGVAKTTSSIIMAALKVIEKVYDIKKKAQEVRALELANNAAEKSLEEAAESQRKNGVKEIIDDTVNNVGLDKDGEGDKIAALTKAVMRLVDFIEKGGQVDFVLPVEEDSDAEAESADISEERKNLRTVFKQVRYLEKKIHLPEHKDV